MNLTQIADKVIPAARNKKVLLKKRYSTGDIVQEVLACYEQSKDQVKDLAPYLRGSTVKDTCRNIWNFLKYNVGYSVDPRDVQWVKEPAKVWHDKVCDCKSYAIFIASLLAALGINGCFRFVSFNSEPYPTHVYIVVRYQGKDIVMDDVMPAFDDEKPYRSKKDYSMKGLYRVSGLPTVSATPGRRPGLPVIGCSCNAVGSYPFDLDPANKGKFTDKAKRAGMGVQQFAGHVLANKNRYPDTTVREAVFARNARKFSHVNGLPVIGDGDPYIGDPLQGLKNILSGSKAHDLIVQMAPALLYQYLPSDQRWFKDPNAAAFWATMPNAVKQKMNGIVAFGDFAHDKWGWKWQPLAQLIHHTLVQLLGMEPQHYLALTINPAIDNYTNNSSAAIGAASSSKADQILSVIDQAGGQATGASSVPGASQSSQFSMAQMLTDLTQSLVSFKIPAGSQANVIGPNPADWAGYATAMKLGVVAPTPQDPLGAGINNGIYDSNGNVTNVQPTTTTQIQNGKVVTVPYTPTTSTGAPATTASMNPLLIIGLAGAAAFMFFGGKKKGKK